MSSLPRKAQIYLVFVCMLGVLTLASTFCFRFPQAQAAHWELAVFLLLTVLAGSKKIKLMRHAGADDVGSMSLGFAITFATMVRFGPVAGLMTGVVSCLSACLYPKRQPVHQIAFNVSLSGIETWLAGIVFLVLNGWTLHLRPMETFIAVVGAVLTSYLINTGGVAVIIALCTDQKPWPLWKETFLWTAPSYFAGASVSTLAMVLFGRHAATILLFISPAIYLTYQSYATYMARIGEKQQHIDELKLSQEHLADLYLSTIKSLALAIDAKDQYTHQHILRVQRYAVGIAKHMGLSGAELEGVNTGALLHDIGKLGVPEYVLLKPGRLTEEEFAKIKKHPEIGAAILDPVEFPWPVLPAVKYHHEKWNGTGYPDGLKGEEIPLTARILAVADVYDALTSTRSYRTAWPHEKALAVIQKDAGTHFDPAIVDVFSQVIEGIITEMAAEGDGPLIVRPDTEKSSTSKSAQAARDIQRASSELWAMYEVVQTLSSSLGLQETAEILARKLEAIFPGVACLFLLKEEGKLSVCAAVGVNAEYFASSHTINELSRSLRVVNSRKAFLGAFDPDDLMLASSEFSVWRTLRSALIIPVVHQGEILGSINMYHPDVDAFGMNDMELLEAMAERAAMALYNGMLYDRTRSDAKTDPLTGAYNIRYLTHYLEQRCSRDTAAPATENAPAAPQGSAPVPPTVPFALLCLDLDAFKPINDNFGHQKGDEVLNELASIFRSTVGESNIVARYGGDEFLIVLEGADGDAAEAMARSIHQAVEAYDAGLIHYKLGKLRLGLCIGYACFPQDGKDYATLLSTADANMYRFKTERKLRMLAGHDSKARAAASDAASLPHAA